LSHKSEGCETFFAASVRRSSFQYRKINHFGMRTSDKAQSVNQPGVTRDPIDFQRKFRERLCRLVHLPELFTVASHEPRNFTGGLGKMQSGSVHCLL
jgi:hypothetical protein